MASNNSGSSTTSNIDTAYSPSFGDSSQVPMAFAVFESGLSPPATSPPTDRSEMKQSPTGSADLAPNPAFDVTAAGGEGSFGAPWLGSFAAQGPVHNGFAHHPLPLALLGSSLDPHHQQPSGLPGDVTHLIPNALPAHMWPGYPSPSQAFGSPDQQTAAPPTTLNPHGSHESFFPDTGQVTVEQANLSSRRWDGTPTYSEDMQFPLAESGQNFQLERRHSIDSQAATVYSAGSPPVESESGLDLKPPGSHDIQRSYSDSAAAVAATTTAAATAAISCEPSTLASSSISPPPARSLRKLPIRGGRGGSSSSSATATTVILAPAATLPPGSVPVPSALQERTWQTWAPWINSLPDDDLKALETRQLHSLRYSPGMTQAQRDLTDRANERMMAARNFKRRQINNAAAARSRARKNEALDAARRNADDQARLRDEATAEAAMLRNRLAVAEEALEASRAENEALTTELNMMKNSEL